MGIDLEQVKKLKELAGVGLTDAKVALEEAKGDFDKALDAMRKKGMTKAEKRGDRETREGLIEGYVHDGRIGALIEVNCETSFVAKTPEFKELAHYLAMQVASMNPMYVSLADIPEKEMKRVRDEALAEMKDDKKPAEIKEKIVEGRVRKYFAEKVLMTQAYILDDSKTVEEFIKTYIAKTGENIVVKQMRRLELGVSE
ncbi:elongation factor Ts [Candidatus Saccharibacteria bacterium]|nr:elongation factor Ts [Candidatus Saccharibacteria bacterium]